MKKYSVKVYGLNRGGLRGDIWEFGEVINEEEFDLLGLADVAYGFNKDRLKRAFITEKNTCGHVFLCEKKGFGVAMYVVDDAEDECEMVAFDSYTYDDYMRDELIEAYENGEDDE